MNGYCTMRSSSALGLGSVTRSLSSVFTVQCRQGRRHWQVDESQAPYHCLWAEHSKLSLAVVRLQQGESVKWVDEDGVMVCKWKDKRDVFMIPSNFAVVDRPMLQNVWAATMRTWEVLIISTICGPTTVWDELADVGGRTSSGNFSTSASSMRMCSGWWRPLPANQSLFGLK